MRLIPIFLHVTLQVTLNSDLGYQEITVGLEEQIQFSSKSFLSHESYGKEN